MTIPSEREQKIRRILIDVAETAVRDGVQDYIIEGYANQINLLYQSKVYKTDVINCLVCPKEFSNAPNVSRCGKKRGRIILNPMVMPSWCKLPDKEVKK